MIEDALEGAPRLYRVVKSVYKSERRHTKEQPARAQSGLKENEESSSN